MLEWIASSYSTIGFVTFFVCYFHDDRDFWQSVLLGIVWPVYVIKFIVKFLSE